MIDVIIFAPLSLPSLGSLVSSLPHQLDIEMLVWFFKLCVAALFFSFPLSLSSFFFFFAFRLVLCRPSLGPSPGHMIGLIVPTNSNFVPSGLGLRPARMRELFSFVFLSFLFLPSSFFARICPFLPLFVLQSFLVLFFGCTHVPRLCSWCYIAASNKGSCTTGRHSAVPFAYWYCSSARTILFAYFHRDVYCSLFCHHGLDFRKMS